MKRWIFSSLLTLATSVSLASTTKVGNGNDGDDLEGGTPITKGIIFETRNVAVARLKALNIQGIAGLGFVIPELEHTQLLMAAKDVKPLSSEGEWEATEDRHQTYARTFAEPHAPTRFFPVALTLTREQLIALHTHEALHRALPQGVREDEEKVAMLTLALTSHSATFDRVNRVAQNLLNEPRAPRMWSQPTMTTTVASVPRPTPVSKDAEMFAEGSALNSYYGDLSWMRIGGEISPFDPLEFYGNPLDPRLKVEGFFIAEGGGVYAGPLSFTGSLPVTTSGGNRVGPFARLSLRSLEADTWGMSLQNRDVYTGGLMYERNRPGNYSNQSFSYTLSDGRYGTIWSYDARLGAKVRRFDLGGKLGVYHQLANEGNPSQTFVQAGPEARYVAGKWKFTLAASALLNRRDYRQLDELGDIAGHGAGDAQVSAGMIVEL